MIPPQQLHIVPTFANVYLAQTATFTCSATGYNISYRWKIGLSFFPKKATGINTNTLVIPSVGLSDDNTYTCVASNEGGSVSSKATRLTVIGMYVQELLANMRREYLTLYRAINKVEGFLFV